MTKKDGIHTMSTRVPEPLYQAASAVSSFTGQSLNQMVVQGLELVVENFNSSPMGAATLTSTVSVPDVSAVRASYSDSPRWSQPRRTTGLTRWSSTDEEKTEDDTTD